MHQINKMTNENWLRSSAFAYVCGASPRWNDPLENLEMRMLRLIQDFDSLSIFVTVLPSLLAIYSWRDPFAYNQTMTRSLRLQSNHDEIPSSTNHTSCVISHQFPVTKVQSKHTHTITVYRILWVTLLNRVCKQTRIMNKHSTHTLYLLCFSLQLSLDKWLGKMTNNNLQKERH